MDRPKSLSHKPTSGKGDTTTHTASVEASRCHGDEQDLQVTGGAKNPMSVSGTNSAAKRTTDAATNSATIATTYCRTYATANTTADTATN